MPLAAKPDERCVRALHESRTAAFLPERPELRLDKKAFSVEITIQKASPESASQLLAALPPTFKTFREKTAAIVRQKLIDATSFSLKKDQVFIVTRLPRASIDSLIAKDVN